MMNRFAGRPAPRDLVLVWASGGVAAALVQCAKLAGAMVVATAGLAAKVAQIQALGPDWVVLRDGA